MVKPQPDLNQVCLGGVLTEVRQRWTPDGSFAVIASLELARPELGPSRASTQETQPIPLRATGRAAETINRLQGKSVAVKGILRRRYYSRDNQPHWGQVEIWVDDCRPIQVQED